MLEQQRILTWWFKRGTVGKRGTRWSVTFAICCVSESKKSYEECLCLFAEMGEDERNGKCRWLWYKLRSTLFKNLKTKFRNFLSTASQKAISTLCITQKIVPYPTGSVDSHYISGRQKPGCGPAARMWALRNCSTTYFHDKFDFYVSLLFYLDIQIRIIFQFGALELWLGGKPTKAPVVTGLCEGNVMLVSQGQTAVDQQTTSWMSLLANSG